MEKVMLIGQEFTPVKVGIIEIIDDEPNLVAEVEAIKAKHRRRRHRDAYTAKRRQAEIEASYNLDGIPTGKFRNGNPYKTKWRKGHYTYCPSRHDLQQFAKASEEWYEQSYKDILDITMYEIDRIEDEFNAHIVNGHKANEFGHDDIMEYQIELQKLYNIVDDILDALGVAY